MPLEEVVRSTGPKPRPLGGRKLDLSGSVRDGILAEAAKPPRSFMPVQQVADARAQLSQAIAGPTGPLEQRAVGYMATMDNDPDTGVAPVGDRMGAYEAMRTMQPDYVAPEPTIGVDTARVALDDALRGQRVAALNKGSKPKKATPIRKQVDRMTAEEYEALTPTQKAAVEFNAMLVQAVRKDRKLGEDYDPTKKQEQRYEESVEQMFGADRGSEQYAPETLAVLKQIDFQDEHADLDDFLGLKAAIRVKDLDDLQPPSTPPAVTVSGESPMSDLKLERVSLGRGIAEATQEMAEALAKGNQLLQTVGVTAAAARADSVKLLGGDPREVAGSLGYQTPNYDANGVPLDVNSYFQQAFEGLSNPEIDSEFVLNDARTVLSPEEFGAFMSYAEQRSGNAQQYGGRLGVTDGVKYRTPEEFRKLLGLDREAR